MAEEQVQQQAVSPLEARQAQLAQELVEVKAKARRLEWQAALVDSAVGLVMLLLLAMAQELVWWSVLPLALGFAVFRAAVALLQVQ